MLAWRKNGSDSPSVTGRPLVKPDAGAAAIPSIREPARIDSTFIPSASLSCQISSLTSGRIALILKATVNNVWRQIDSWRMMALIRISVKSIGAFKNSTDSMIRIAILFLAGLALAGCSSNKVLGDASGGIVNWSFGNEVMADAIALDHCKYYGRTAQVTRINRRPGEGIEFKCFDYPVPPEPGYVALPASHDVYVKN